MCYSLSEGLDDEVLLLYALMVALAPVTAAGKPSRPAESQVGFWVLSALRLRCCQKIVSIYMTDRLCCCALIVYLQLVLTLRNELMFALSGWQRNLLPLCPPLPQY